MHARARGREGRRRGKKALGGIHPSLLTMAANPFQQDAAGAAFMSLPRLAGRLTADLVMRSHQGLNACKEYQLDLRGACTHLPVRGGTRLGTCLRVIRFARRARGGTDGNGRTSMPLRISSRRCSDHRRRCRATRDSLDRSTITGGAPWTCASPLTAALPRRLWHFTNPSTHQGTRLGRLRTWGPRRTSSTPSTCRTTRW